jgi:hypothetical protein
MRKFERCYCKEITGKEKLGELFLKDIDKSYVLYTSPLPLSLLPGIWLMSDP